jgi:hypothetical protein
MAASRPRRSLRIGTGTTNGKVLLLIDTEAGFKRPCTCRSLGSKTMYEKEACW